MSRWSRPPGGRAAGRVSRLSSPAAVAASSNTSIHLHFDCHRTITGKLIRQPVYSSLVASFRRALGRPPAIQGNQLAFDNDRELGGGGGAPAIGDEGAGPLADGSDIPKTEQTKNYGALTVSTNRGKWPAYLKTWPGILPASEGLIDKNGGLIVAFKNEASGVGAWWYWITQRKKHGETGTPTFTQLARGIAGDGASDDALNRYLAQYTKLSSRYFGREIGPDEPISLADPPTRWQLARTMFHHESGRAPVITQDTFECGVALGHAVIAGQAVDPVRFTGNCSALPPVALKGGEEKKTQPPIAWKEPELKPGTAPRPPLLIPPGSLSPGAGVITLPEIGDPNEIAYLRMLVQSLQGQLALGQHLLHSAETRYRIQMELERVKAQLPR